MPTFRSIARKWQTSRLFRLVVACVVIWFVCGVGYWWFECAAAPADCDTLPLALVEMFVLLVANEIMTVPHSAGGMAAALVAALCSVVIAAVLVAEIASIFIESRLYGKEGVYKVDFSDHIIVCHAGPSLPDVIKELTSEQQAVRQEVAIVSTERPEVPLSDYVQWVKGDPTEDETLHRAGVEKARAAIVLCADMAEPVTSDSENILTALAIESLNGEVHTCVELIDEKNRKHLKHADVDEVICVGELSKKLSIQSVLNPGLSRMIGDLLSFDHTEEFYRVLVPEDCVGHDFGEALNWFFANHGAILVAIQRGERYTLAASNDRPLEEEDIAIIVAEEFPKGLKAPTR